MTVSGPSVQSLDAGRLGGDGGKQEMQASRNVHKLLEDFLVDWGRLRCEALDALQNQIEQQDVLVENLVQSLQHESSPAVVDTNLVIEENGTANGNGLAVVRPAYQSSASVDTHSSQQSGLETSQQSGLDTAASMRTRKPSYVYVTDRRDIFALTGSERNFVLKVVHWWSHLDEPKREGRLARLIETKEFTLFSYLVIVLTMLYTISLADMQAREVEHNLDGFKMVGNVLSLLYVIEVGLRVMVHRLYFFANSEAGWNIFDFVLASIEVWSLAFSILEESTGIKMTFLRSLRVLRITRILRMFKIVNAFKVLRMLLDAMVSSLSTLAWCAVVMVFTLTICAMLFVQLVTEYKMEYGCVGVDPAVCAQVEEDFGSILQAMLTLFMSTSGGQDWYVYYDRLNQLGPNLAYALVVFTFVVQFGFYNLMTSMFVNQAMKSSQPDIDMMVIDQRIAEVEQATRLKQQFHKFDGNGDGSLQWHEFEAMLRDPAMRSFLAAAGLEITDAEIFFHMLAEVSDISEVPIDMFVQGAMRMKGAATSIDLQTLQFEVGLMAKDVHQMLARMDQLERSVQAPAKAPQRFKSFAKRRWLDSPAGLTKGSL